MCGITGFFSQKECSEQFFIQNLTEMNNSLEHRGPDTGDIWFDKNSSIGFAHRRLSILDLSESGNQPMISECGRYVIVFNGEIYNHLLLREEINSENINCHWRGTSDTETLLSCISYWGLELTLQKARGMFAFSLWDKERKELILGRDRLGEKPLYFGWNNDFFLFGSELKAMKKHSAFIGEIDKEALALYLKYSYVPCPKSIYKGISKLEQGTIARVSLKSREIKIQNYWSLLDTVKAKHLTQEYHLETSTKYLDNLLNTVVQEQMISDVPIGANLSGGIDSSTIVCIMQSLSDHPIKTFTIGFEEKDFDESAYALETSKYLGTDHTEIQVSSKDLLSVVPKLHEIYDEPFADSSQIPTYLVSHLASRDVKVSLSGDGGDEIFSGYNRYRFTSNIWPKISLFPKSLRNILANSIVNIKQKDLDRISNFLPFLNRKFNNVSLKVIKSAKALGSEDIDKYYESLVSTIDNPNLLMKEKDLLISKRKELVSEPIELSLTERIMIQDTMTYLPDDILVKLDRAAMSVSLETRVPFLDPRIVEFAWSLPIDYKIKGSKTKRILREVLSNYLPDRLIDRPKMGFSIPIDDWLRGPLRDWAEALLDKQTITRRGLLDPEYIESIWKQHLNRNINQGSLLWNVLMFQLWIESN